jgi:hypothetical protein
MTRHKDVVKIDSFSVKHFCNVSNIKLNKPMTFCSTVLEELVLGWSRHLRLVLEAKVHYKFPELSSREYTKK